MLGGQETSWSVISAGVGLFPCGCNTYSCQVGAGWYLCWNIWILATLQWIFPCGTWVPEAIASVGASSWPPGVENGETLMLLHQHVVTVPTRTLLLWVSPAFYYLGIPSCQGLYICSNEGIPCSKQRLQTISTAILLYHLDMMGSFASRNQDSSAAGLIDVQVINKIAPPQSSGLPVWSYSPSVAASQRVKPHVLSCHVISC